MKWEENFLLFMLSIFTFTIVIFPFKLSSKEVPALKPSDINYVVVHHTSMRDTKKSEFSEIKNLHVNVRGWDDIAYHGIVEKVGSSFVFEKGRSEDVVGSHEEKMNHRSLGIAFNGDFQKRIPSIKQLRVGAKVVADWVVKYKIPLTNIIPHRKPDKTTLCPGTKFPLMLFKELVRYEVFKNGLS